jgi:hypothetical protein
MKTDKELLDISIELLKRWHLANTEFDMDKWVADVRNFIEDDLEDGD